MKKLVLIAALITIVSGTTAFGQGWVNWGQGRYGVGNQFTTGALTFGNTDVALYIATTAGSGAPLPEVEALSSGTPTNTVMTWTANAAWTDILTDPNYQLALDVVGGVSAIMGVNSGSHGGYYQYVNVNDNVEFNTAAGMTPGANYNMYVVAWNSAYSNPTAAALAGSLVGWSQMFTYATGATALSTVVQTSIPAFGVVPEPSTIALAGLGGLSLLLFRRRK